MCCFDAGIPEGNRFLERVYSYLRDMDRQGKLPVYIDGCYVVTRKEQVNEALRELRRVKKEFKDDFKMRVTCAHLEIQDDADLERFAK